MSTVKSKASVGLGILLSTIFGASVTSLGACVGDSTSETSGQDAATGDVLDAVDAIPPDGALSADSDVSDAGPDTATSGDASADAAPSCDCVKVPPGWQGPVGLWEGTPKGAPSCTGAYGGAATDLHSHLSAPDATCSSCSCAPAIGQECAASVTVYGSSSCGTTLQTLSINTNGSCTDFASVGSSAEYTWSTSGGSCLPSGGVATLPGTTWTNAARTCAYNGSTSACTNGGTCYAWPTSPFGGLCVQQTGDVACPSAFPNKYTYYSGVTDTRSCSSCTCDSPSGGSCAGYMEYWSSGSCSGGSDGESPPGTCEPGAKSSVWAKIGLADAGACVPDGGQPQGAAAAANPTTVCCE